MQTYKYPLAADSFEQEEIEAAIETLKSGRYTMGEKVQKFEQELADWTGSKNAVMVNSGSSANLVLVEALLRKSNAPPLKVGDEVLVPALSWPTTVWPLSQLGLVPVFVDINPETLAIDLEKAQTAISPRTKAMFLIHVLGRAAPVKKYLEFCKSNNLVFFEDCCESFGAFSEGKHVGTQGFGGTLSHFFSHHLTTIEGGTVLTNDDDLADDLRSFRAHGWTRNRKDKARWEMEYPNLDPRFMFITTGYNVRPTELHAAIGSIQLPRMKPALEKRTRIARMAAEAIRNIEGLKLIGSEVLETDLKVKDYSARQHSWMNLPFRTSGKLMGKLSKILQSLETAGIETRPIIAGDLTEHPAVKKISHRVSGTLENSKDLLKNGFMLGCHPQISDDGQQALQTALSNLGSL